MSIQPGAGYSFSLSNYGTTLDINQPWTPPQGDSNPVQQFETILAETGATAKVMVASGSAFIAGPGQSVGGEGMKEWFIKTFSVFPTGARTTGSDVNSPWASQGGTVDIANAASGGNDTWYVYLVANNYDNSSADSAYPMLAVIAEGSDAYTKSRPFSVDDDIRWFQPYIQTSSVTVTDTGGSTISGQFLDGVGMVIQNYNCRRMTIAKIVWTDDHWVVTQYLYGPVTFTSDVRIGTLTVYADGAPTPWPPSYATEQSAWVGSWTGYTKDYSHDTLIPL